MRQKNDGIIEFLNKDKLKNISIINFMESYPVHFEERIGDLVLIKGISDREWVYISSYSEDELQAVKAKLEPKDKNFAVMEEWMIPIITEGRKVKWELPTVRLVLPIEASMPQQNNIFSSLKAENAEFIYNSSDYKDFLSVEYIIERIENGINCCVRDDGKPIAWGITQDDGAIGFLHVLPEYRKRGLGKSIMIELINKVRDSGKIPFVHIEEENEASIKLALTLGFVRDRVVSWFEMEHIIK